jgi:hypothetical protein
MRKRVLLWAGLLVALAGTGLVGVWWQSTRLDEPGVTVANFRRLAVGMTEQQCCRILGMPVETDAAPPQAWEPSLRIVTWEGPGQQVAAAMCFNSSGRAAGGMLYKWTSPNMQTTIASLNMGFDTDTPESLLTRLRRWLGL